jgi:tetratricopeptide (TPR) repeat protein
MDELAKRIKQITDNAKSNPNAVNEMIALTEEFPEAPDVWCDLAYLYSRQGDRVSSVDALGRAIALAPDEPVYLFDRARYNAALGEYRSVIDDASRGIEISERLKFLYYKDSLIFLRAYAMVALGNSAAARDDLTSMEDHGMRLWINGLVTWEDLARRCGVNSPP